MAGIVQLSEFVYQHNLASKMILLGPEVLTDDEKLLAENHIGQCRICRLRTSKLAESRVRELHPEQGDLFAFTFPDQYLPLSDEEREIVISHLATCKNCRNFVSLLIRLDSRLSS